MNISSTNGMHLRSGQLGQLEVEATVATYEPETFSIDMEDRIEKGVLKDIGSWDGRSLSAVRGSLQAKVKGARHKAIASAAVGALSFAAAAASIVVPQLPSVALFGFSTLGVGAMVQAERFNQRGDQLATLDLVLDNAHRPHLTGHKLGFDQEPTTQRTQLRADQLL
jgi:hypothetical protein